MKISRLVYRTIMPLQLHIHYYKEVHTDLKNSITSQHSIKNSFVKRFAKETTTCPIIKSINTQFQTNIFNPDRNDIIISTEITSKI